MIRRSRRLTASRTNHAEPPRRAPEHSSTSDSIIDARGAEKTSCTNKKVIFMWAGTFLPHVEILPIHVDNGPSGWRVPASRRSVNDLRANMKLVTKGLLLIAVPSLVELALLGVVFDTQEQTAQAAQWVTTSKQILYQSSALVDPLLRQAARVRTGMVIGDPSLLDRHTVWIDMSDRLSKLDALVADTPQQVQRVQNMRRAIDAYRAQTVRISEALHDGQSPRSLAALGLGLSRHRFRRGGRPREFVHRSIPQPTRLRVATCLRQP